MGRVKASVVYMSKDNQKKGVKIAINNEKTVGEFLDKLIEKLDLPESDGLDRLEYVLFSRRKGVVLSRDKTFIEQEVTDDETLILKVKKNVRPVDKKEEVAPVLTCPICRSEVSPDDVVCGECGQRLAVKKAVRQEETSNDKNVKAEKPKKRGGVFLLALIVVLLVSLSFAAGTILEQRGIIDVFTYIRPQTETKTEETTSAVETTTQEPTTLDENLIMVEVTIQGSFFDENNRPSDTLSQEQKELGYTSVKINSDGSVTYKIRKPAWRKIIEEFRSEMKKSIDESVDSYDYIKKITCNDDFSQFNISVDKALYESKFDSAVCLSLYIGAGYYQMYDLKEPKCTFSITDALTGNVIDTLIYPLEKK